MKKERIEPRFGDTAAPGGETERFVVEPRTAPGSTQTSSQEEAERQALSAVKWFSWAIAIACIVFLASEAFKLYVAHQRAQQVQSLIDQFAEGLQSATRSLRVQQLQQQNTRSNSAQGRWLNKNCQDWRNAFIANPLPTAREEMQRHCQAYQRYLQTGQVAAEFRVPR